MLEAERKLKRINAARLNEKCNLMISDPGKR
jgi:hypothetical protein